YGSNGRISLLDIKPGSLHQRTPVFIGSQSLVKKVEEFIDS
ncbi:MAG: class 1 fructose-bisphosphatase, partial [Chloroflexota bacterium]